MKSIFITIFILYSAYVYSQVGIGTTNPNTASALDITATNKGILIPRVSLISTNITSPITAPAISLLVYNTNTSSAGATRVTPGFYYWNGGSWVTIQSGSDGNTLDQAYDQGGFYGAGRIINATHGAVEIRNGRFEITSNIDANGFANSGSLEIGNRLRIDGDEIVTNNNTLLNLQNGNKGDLGVDGSTLYVDASANRVGIGTTAPVDRFHVAGGRVEFTNTNDASGLSGTGVLEIGNSLRIDGNEIITNNNTLLLLQNDNNGDLKVDNTTFIVDASANRVGIGDTTPDAKLDVYTTINETAVIGISVLGHGASFRAANTAHGFGWWFCGAPIPCGNATNFSGRTGVSTSGEGTGILAVANLDADASTDHTGGLFVVRNGNAIRSIVAVGADVNGTVYKIIGHGSVSTLVKDTDNNLRIMHAPETPEALFQDYGEGQLVNGRAVIKIDPIFSNNIVVDDKHPLRVFIQLKGDCKGTYVTKETVNGFEVRELQGGTSNVKFSYSITANRKDEILAGKISKYQDLRFEKIKDGKYIIE